jgi:hypothetical protein
MQRQQLYSFQFLDWKFPCSNESFEPHRVTITQGIMVGPERTRKGKLVIKTRKNWDNEARTQIEVNQRPGDNSMDQCHYFWECMHYSAVRSFIDDVLEYGDALWEDSNTPIKVPEVPLPQYGVRIDYFDWLVKAIPSLEIKRIDNGY